MAYTVIGVYDNYSEAESAENELLSGGVPRYKMHLGLIEDTALGRRAELQQLVASDDESTSPASLADFFHTMVGNGQQDNDIYMEAVRRGSYVLMVNAESDDEAHRAIDVMAHHHPVNIDERSSQWRNRGWSHYDPNASVMSEAEIDSERSLLPETEPSLPVYQVQGDPVKDAAAKPAGETLRGISEEAQRLGIRSLSDEAQRLGVRLYQRGW